jgi:hypothetical protein
VLAAGTRHGRASTIGVGGVDGDRAGRAIPNATRNKDAGIDTRSSHIFVCKSDGRMGKHCSGKDGGDPAVGLLSHHAR